MSFLHPSTPLTLSCPKVYEYSVFLDHNCVCKCVSVLNARQQINPLRIEQDDAGVMY